MLAALPCPVGSFLNGVTQQCDQCAVGLVTTSTGSIACVKCPPHFAWASSSLCVSCPANSVTSPNDAAQCACDFGYYDSLFGANLTAPVCLPCPLGGVCTSGFVGAADGFWRETSRSHIFYPCRVGNCLEEAVIGPLNPAPPNGTAPRPLPQLVVNAAAPTNCARGNDGPLCGSCLPGYSLQSGVCAPCDPKDAFANWSSGSQAGLLIGCATVGVIVLTFGLFQPLSPGLERTSAAAIAAAHALKQALVTWVKACISLHHSQALTDDAAGAPAATPDAGTAAEDHVGGDSVLEAAKSKVSEVEDLRNTALDDLHNMSTAFAVGTALMDEDGGSTNDGSNAGAVDAALELQDELEALMDKLAKYLKIIVKCDARLLCVSAGRLTLPPARAALPQLLPGARCNAALCRATLALLTKLRADRVHLPQEPGHPVAACVMCACAPLKCL